MQHPVVRAGVDDLTTILVALVEQRVVLVAIDDVVAFLWDSRDDRRGAHNVAEFPDLGQIIYGARSVAQARLTGTRDRIRIASADETDDAFRLVLPGSCACARRGIVLHLFTAEIRAQRRHIVLRTLDPFRR